MDFNKMIKEFAGDMAKVSGMVPTYSAYLISRLKIIPGLAILALNSTASGAEGRVSYRNQTYRVTIEPERKKPGTN
jgi:hypothetical protein